MLVDDTLPSEVDKQLLGQVKDSVVQGFQVRSVLRCVLRCVFGVFSVCFVVCIAVCVAVCVAVYVAVCDAVCAAEVDKQLLEQVKDFEVSSLPGAAYVSACVVGCLQCCVLRCAGRYIL